MPGPLASNWRSAALFRSLCYLSSVGIAISIAFISTWFGLMAEPDEVSPVDPLIAFALVLILQLGLLLAPTAAARPSRLFRVIVGLGLLPPLAFLLQVLAEHLGLFGRRPESPLFLFVSLPGVAIYSWALYRVAAGPQVERSSVAG
jgi:hypothetical protein